MGGISSYISDRGDHVILGNDSHSVKAHKIASLAEHQASDYCHHKSESPVPVNVNIVDEGM